MKGIALLLLLGLTLAAVSCGDSSRLHERTMLASPFGEKIYFGVFPDFGGTEENVTAQRIRDFGRIADKQILWVYFSSNWWHGIRYPKKRIHTIIFSRLTTLCHILDKLDTILLIEKFLF